MKAALEQVAAPFPADVTFVQLAIDNVRPSRTNPRGKHWRETLPELVESVRRQGILMPVLVRPLGGEEYELVSGHRRHAAAREAGHGTIPATVRELTDVEVLEIQITENVQRSDLDPLDEAEGYARLMRSPGYNVERVAERIGKSVKYVYDRVKLLALTKDARALLLEEKITAGHAILLARLSPADQARAMREGALLERQRLLFDPDEADSDDEPVEKLKPVSVREFADWIDKNVRFDAAKVDPMLFPETAAAVEGKPKVVPITHLNYVPEDARDGKTVGPKSWKRADGTAKAKTCERSTLGFVAVGPHRGDAFEVCIDKEKCAVHWGAELRERKKRAAERERLPGTKAAAASPVAPKQVDRRLADALEKASEQASEQIEKLLSERIGAMSPEKFLRSMVHFRGPTSFQHDLALSGEKVRSEADVVKWFESAPLPQVQRAIFSEATDGYEQEEAGRLGVDVKAIHKEHESRARAEFKAQTSAEPKAAAAKKPGKNSRKRN